jgi:hypothetical protein
MHFLKHHLTASHYFWLEEGKKNIFVGQPSRRVFDRYNGDQVLFMINFYGSLFDRSSIMEGKEIENHLINQLPIETQSELSVFRWLRSTMRHQKMIKP